jgi:hypothetical protein
MIIKQRLYRSSLILLLLIPVLRTQADWHPAAAPLTTPWTNKVDSKKPLPEHPRPDFMRDSWKSLNGLWDYTLEPVEFTSKQGFIEHDSMTRGLPPAHYIGKILVPFAIDAPLSGVMHILHPNERLWYHRDFEVPDKWTSERVLLHFEACDWETSIYLNGKRIGQHRGGYDAFQFDLTDNLKSGKNTLVVCIWDATAENDQPIGKQVMPENKRGFHYQPTGGIWQTVWLEAVPEKRLEYWRVVPNLNGFNFTAKLNTSCPTDVLRILIPGQKSFEVTCGNSEFVSGSYAIEKPKLWSPKEPNLYDLKIELADKGEVIDRVSSYVGLRTITKDSSGRILLNGKPAPLMFGPLDQGYWPDGILTPPDDAAICFDLEYIKSIGCNLVRIHMKTQPSRWYYYADRLGLLVWQDMIGLPKNGQIVDQAASDNWRHEFKSVIEAFYNHPSIMLWVVFNEAWGQHRTIQNTDWVSSIDQTRLVTGASGWNDCGSGDVLDVHNYYGYPSAPVSDGFGHNRALVFGEVGGNNLLIDGHLWVPNEQKGKILPLELADKRMTYSSISDMALKYPFYIRNLRHFVARQNYQAIVYTQLSDVEHECNGWLTYDRKFSKLPAETLLSIHKSLSIPLTYHEMLSDTKWLAGNIDATPSDATTYNASWANLDSLPKAFQLVALPHTGDFRSTQPVKELPLGLRKTFSVTDKPDHAVLEIRAMHIKAHATPPTERLDGMREAIRPTIIVTTYLDGHLHRHTRIADIIGQGEAVTYLELTDNEIDRLTPGKHTLGIEIDEPSLVASFDVHLLSYTEDIIIH